MVEDEIFNKNFASEIFFTNNRLYGSSAGFATAVFCKILSG